MDCLIEAMTLIHPFTSVSVVNRIKIPCYESYEIQMLITSFLEPRICPKENRPLYITVKKKSELLRLIQRYCLIQKMDFGWKDTNEALFVAAERGNFDLLEWLLEHLIFQKGYDNVSACLMDAAAKGGQMQMLEWLKDKPYARGAFYGLVEPARNNNFEILKWLYERRCRYCSYTGIGSISISAFYAAQESGDLEIMKWVTKRLPYIPMNHMISAAKNGQLDVIKWLHENYNVEYSSRTLFYAAWKKHLHVLEWLVANGRYDPIPPDPHHNENIMNAAAISGDLNIVKWVHKQIERNPQNLVWIATTEAMDKAAIKGHLHIVQWLHANRTEGCSTAAMDNAASMGYFVIVKWLHENRTEGCTTAAIDNAARGGHVDIVKWLHVNRSEGCTTKAMDNAASSGHLHIVKWLHENRYEGCSTKAMDGAASGGHLEVVQWLHLNRTEGCTTQAMDRAASNGHLHVVKWLHMNRNESCTVSAMDDALYRGFLNVAKWLHEHRMEGCTEAAIQYAAWFGRMKIVKWVVENHSERVPFDVMKFALREGHLDTAKYIAKCGYGKIIEESSILERCWKNDVPAVKWILENIHVPKEWIVEVLDKCVGCAKCSEVVALLKKYQKEMHSTDI